MMSEDKKLSIIYVEGFFKKVSIEVILYYNDKKNSRFSEYL